MSVTKERRKETIKRRIYRRSGRGNTRFTRVLERALQFRKERERERKKGKRKRKRKNLVAVGHLVSASSRAGERRTREEPRTETSRCSLRLSVIVSRKRGRSVCSYLEKSARGETRCGYYYRFPRILLVTFSFTRRRRHPYTFARESCYISRSEGRSLSDLCPSRSNFPLRERQIAREVIDPETFRSSKQIDLRRSNAAKSTRAG